MNGQIDLDAYLERIEWGGPIRPTFDTLAGLLDAHMLRIPFEGLDVLLGRPVRLDLESLQNKLVHARRGGYCFEHVTLFAAVLERLGFQPLRHTARVVRFAPRSESPRTHMILKVALPEGTFVVDPGLGGLAPRVPVPLDGAVVRSGHEAHWMASDAGYWVLRAQTARGVVDAWVTTFDADNLVDFEVGNHFTSTHPASPFLNRLMLRALTADGRASVMNRDVTITRGSEESVSQLADRAALRSLLIRHFGFDLPQVEHLRVPSIPEWQ